MLQKIHLFLGAGLVICTISLLCLFFVFTDSKKTSQPENYFDMTIEELMQIKVTQLLPETQNHA